MLIINGHHHIRRKIIFPAMGRNDIKHYDTQQSDTQNNGINHYTRPMSSKPAKSFIK
jgi:hypothetical protein